MLKWLLTLGTRASLISIEEETGMVVDTAVKTGAPSTHDFLPSLPRLHPMIKPPRVVAILAAFAAPLAVADTITLKNGTSYEGTIIRETEEEIVMTVVVTPSITDDVVIRKEEIRGAAVKTPDDILAFEKLKASDIKQNSLTLSAYDEAISACQAFRTAYPASAHTQQVGNQLKSLQEERKRVTQGEVKVNERWYTAPEAVVENYQIKAELLYQQMLQTTGDIPTALNLFDALETKYPASAAFPKAVAHAITLLPQLKAEIRRAVPLAQQKEEKFKEAVQFQPEHVRVQSQAAYEREQERTKRLFTSSKEKWKPFFPAMPESVQSLTTAIAAELPRLQAINTASMKESIALVDAARASLEARKPEEALASLREADERWKANEAIPRLIAAAGKLQEKLLAEQAEREKAEAEAARLKELEELEAREAKK